MITYLAMNEEQPEHNDLEFVIANLLKRIERRLISLEKRVISLECRTPDSSPWHDNYRPVQLESMMMLPEDSPDYEIITKPRVRTFSKGKNKISLHHPVCVQCCKRFILQDNSSCSCIYHHGELRFVNESKYVLSCCQVPVRSRSMVWSVPGCTKGWHCLQHHTSLLYTHYYIYMSNMSLEAQEMWLAMDVLDPVMQACEWAEVGLSSKRRVYVIVGYAREQPLAFKEFTFNDLNECKFPNSEILHHAGDKGWALTVTLQSAKSVAKSLTVSLKAASYKSPLIKKLQLFVSGGTVRPGSTETLSDPTPSVAKGEYTLCESVCSGPVLEPGPDHSLKRKSDYTTLHNSQEFQVSLTQIKSVSVDSSLIRQTNGTWNNLFTTSIMISNESNVDVLIKEMYMEYLNKASDGVWMRCERHWLSVGCGEFVSQCCCPVGSGVDQVVTLRAAIAVTGALAACKEDRLRAHFSLPQPLHLRAVCQSNGPGSASLRLEQGNPPLQLVTREDRERELAVEVPFFCFADDVNSLRRTDVALFYNDDGMLVLRACVYGVGCEDVILYTTALMSAAHYAKKQRRPEYELLSLRRVCYESCVQVFAVVDLQLGVPYALKVDIHTPTSHSTAHHPLPRDDYSTSSLTLNPPTVSVNANTVVSWSLPRASVNDTICVFAEWGRYRLSEVTNSEGVSTGSEHLRAPSSPGVYNVLYYPAWLSPFNSACQHHAHILKASLTVTK